jgi:hypothetical protein
MKKNICPSDKSILFATAFYHSQGKSPNAWTFSERSKIEMYYRCMIVCYGSIRRLYKEAQLTLFTNQDLPEPFNHQLDSLGVNIVFCSNEFVNSSVFSNEFPGCLFTLDVIHALSKSDYKGFDYLILIDNDCILRQRLDKFLEDILESQLIYAYQPGYPVNMVANGQSRASLTLAIGYIQSQLLLTPIPLYGGEFFAIPAKHLPDIAINIDKFWDWMSVEGKSIFGYHLTEEHVMSAAIAMSAKTIGDASKYVKRIWTTEHFSTIDGTESAIPVWHLPSEKKNKQRAHFDCC